MRTTDDDKKHNQPETITPGKLLDILVKLSEIAERNDRSFDRLNDDIQEIKDSRHRPYFTTMGAFLVVIVGVMSYVYNLETRLTSIMFDLHGQIHEIDGFTQVNKERIQVVDGRLEARSKNMEHRWATHTSRHTNIDESFRIIAIEMIQKNGTDIDIDSSTGQ